MFKEESVVGIFTAASELNNKIRLDSKFVLKVTNLAKNCVNALRDGKKIIFAGNGGSFADAQHLSAEFTSKFLMDRDTLSSVALGTNSSSFSAISNDFGYEFTFCRELKSLGKRGDVFIPISTSGNSENIIQATKEAINMNIKTVGLSGVSGGRLSQLVDCICVPSSSTARIQECHILIGHTVCELVEREIFKHGK